jgi:hypothetical protein
MQPQGYTPLGNSQNKCRKVMKVAGICAAVTAVSLLLVACLQAVAPIGQALLRQYTDARQQVPLESMQELCDKLTGSAQQLCHEYVGAVKEDAWDAAAAWRRASPDSCECWPNVNGVAKPHLTVVPATDFAAPDHARVPFHLCISELNNRRAN